MSCIEPQHTECFSKRDWASVPPERKSSPCPLTPQLFPFHTPSEKETQMNAKGTRVTGWMRIKSNRGPKSASYHCCRFVNAYFKLVKTTSSKVDAAKPEKTSSDTRTQTIIKDERQYYFIISFFNSPWLWEKILDTICLYLGNWFCYTYLV